MSNKIHLVKIRTEVENNKNKEKEREKRLKEGLFYEIFKDA